MDLINEIDNRLKEFLKERDSFGATVIRSIKSEIYNKKKELNSKGKVLDSASILSIIEKEAKKRRDACNLYLKGDRKELAEKEKIELKIIEEFLPKQFSDDELEKIIDKAMKSLGNNLNFGEIMKYVMPEVSGKADGLRVSKIVKEKLK